MAILEVKNLKKEFEDLKVIDNISFSVEKGEFLILFGPNGCGKTTLLKLIAGLIEPTSGDVLLHGENLKKKLNHNHKIGFVFQEDRLFPWKTVYENLNIVLEHFFSNEKERQAIIKKYLNLVGLWNFRDYYPNKLSGGMKQKVALARALAIGPEFILLDEPFGALDVYSREKLQEETLRIWRETNKTMVFVTHNIDEALKMGQKIILLSGRPSKIIKKFTDLSKKEGIKKELKNTIYKYEQVK